MPFKKNEELTMPALSGESDTKDLASLVLPLSLLNVVDGLRVRGREPEIWADCTANEAEDHDSLASYSSSERPEDFCDLSSLGSCDVADDNDLLFEEPFLSYQFQGAQGFGASEDDSVGGAGATDISDDEVFPGYYDREDELTEGDRLPPSPASPASGSVECGTGDAQSAADVQMQIYGIAFPSSPYRSKNTGRDCGLGAGPARIVKRRAATVASNEETRFVEHMCDSGHTAAAAFMRQVHLAFAGRGAVDRLRLTREKRRLFSTRGKLPPLHSHRGSSSSSCHGSTHRSDKYLRRHRN